MVMLLLGDNKDGGGFVPSLHEFSCTCSDGVKANDWISVQNSEGKPRTVAKESEQEELNLTERSRGEKTACELGHYENV